MTTTLVTLIQRLSEQIGDWIEEDTTSDIGAGTSIVSTALNQWDHGLDDYFNDWWVYITEGNNSGVLRQVADYATSGGTLSVRGANLSAESGAVTFDLMKYNRENKRKALNDTVREIYPDLHKLIDDKTLITGNWLPDAHFEWWTSSTALKLASTSNAALAQTGTASAKRGGSYSVKVTPSAADGYMYIDSDTWPWLLNLMDKDIDFKAWAYPEVADDATLVIYTIQADGTAQTLTSTTSNPAGYYSLLELESQSINDDITKIEFRFKVASSTKYTYFDNARAICSGVHQYLLPYDVQSGHVDEVHIQTAGNMDDICDDLDPMDWDKIHDWRIIEDGTYRYLWIDGEYPTERQIRLLGRVPLETLSADTDTISLDGEKVNLLIAYAKYKLFQVEEDVPSSLDTKRYETKSARAYQEYEALLSKHRMMKTPGTIKFWGY